MPTISAGAERFSRRLPQSLEENALARAVAARRAAGLPFFDLTESNPTRTGLAWPAQELLDALAQPGALEYQPEPLGLLSAREAVARYFLESRQARVDPSRILLTASTSEAYALLFKLLCDPSDLVLIPAPSYPLFAMLSSLEAVQTRDYPLRWDGEWHLDLPALELRVAGLARASGPRLRAILVVSPGNPTGAFLKGEEHARLCDLCARYQLSLISDEVFADYPSSSEIPPRVLSTAAIDSPALSFTLSGLSKVCALPQLKLGWCAVTGPESLVSHAMQRLELIADTFLSVATPVQLALPQLLARRRPLQERIRARCARNRARLAAARPADATWDLLASEGGWSAVLRIPESRGEEEIALALLERGVLVQPGYFYEFARGSYLVVSLLPEEIPFAEAARILAAAL